MKSLLIALLLLEGDLIIATSKYPYFSKLAKAAWFSFREIFTPDQHFRTFVCVGTARAELYDRDISH